YDAVYLVGGHGTMWDFLNTEGLQNLVASVYNAGGVVGAVCHGPAGLLNGVTPIAGTAGGADVVEATMSGIHNAMVWGAVIALVAFAGSFFVKSVPADEEPDAVAHSPAPAPESTPVH
uniref:DJ-1/PfpI family protein n=1 Tax=Citricoccus sp. TaxID=1978372 RepID=UPI0028BE0A7F